MPDLIDRHNDSSEEDTVEYSVDYSDGTSDTESATPVDEDSSGDENSIRSNGSLVIQIDSIELVRDDIPMSGAHASPVQHVIMEGVIILLIHALTEGPGWLLRYQGNIFIAVL